MNLQQNINRIEEELAEMKLQLKQESTFWEPENGEKAWYITNNGDVYISTCWPTEDSRIIPQGHVFKTRQEALDEVKYRKAKYALRKEIWRLNGGKECPFILRGNNYCVTIQNDTLFCDCWTTTKINNNWFYLESGNLCEQLIGTHSKELKIYLETA